MAIPIYSHQNSTDNALMFNTSSGYFGSVFYGLPISAPALGTDPISEMLSELPLATLENVEDAPTELYGLRTMQVHNGVLTGAHGEQWRVKDGKPWLQARCQRGHPAGRADRAASDPHKILPCHRAHHRRTESACHPHRR